MGWLSNYARGHSEDNSYMNQPKLEKHVESDLAEFCESLGILFKKLKLASETSWPDRTLLYRGFVMFMELKRRGEKPTPLQLHTLELLTKMGFEARWSSDFEQMKLIILAWKQNVDTIYECVARIRADHGQNRGP